MIDPADERDEDVALTGPLSLKNNEVGDQGFLNEVSSKLRDVARSQTFEPEENGEDGTLDPGRGRGGGRGKGRGRNGAGDDGSGGEEFEGPKLRIKRSMNFGSSWGARSCGKGF